MPKTAVITIKAGLWLFAGGRSFLDSFCKHGQGTLLPEIELLPFSLRIGIPNRNHNFWAEMRALWGRQFPLEDL
jgi:hypothetical protein